MLEDLKELVLQKRIEDLYSLLPWYHKPVCLSIDIDLRKHKITFTMSDPQGSVVNWKRTFDWQDIWHLDKSWDEQLPELVQREKELKKKGIESLVRHFDVRISQIERNIKNLERDLREQNRRKQEALEQIETYDL